MRLTILVPTPHYADIDCLLHYQSNSALPYGTLVRVPLGSRELLGIVWNDLDARTTHERVIPDEASLKPIIEVFDSIPALNDHWRELVKFCANYYQRSLGETALNSLPASLKKLTSPQLKKRIKILDKPVLNSSQKNETYAPKLTDEQVHAISAITSQTRPYLLFGATGSGKTEVYMQCVAHFLSQNIHAQALIMVPEINLTPQLKDRFSERFSHWGAQAVVSLHSGMTDPQRLSSWLLAHRGTARIVLGTRLSIFASLPNLALIVVDEEHDTSYKSDSGVRYSARDLAVYRSHKLNISVILGSATPSLESWHHSRPKSDGGRYIRLSMLHRVGNKEDSNVTTFGSQFPKLCLVDMNHQPRNTILSQPLLTAIKERIACGEQSLLLLNQRGYAPVLFCSDCGWKSDCTNCSAYRVFHQLDRTLRCHHCGLTQPVPRACPSCGNLDIRPMGQGTERLEELLTEALLGHERKNGGCARIVRIDADSTRHKGTLEQMLSSVYHGEVDVLIGTQMIAKGHDFRSITLVAAINPDGALYSCDYRASERLFSLLLQVSGRAGRDAQLAHRAQMWVQTWQPTHPLYSALKDHDYQKFADQLLIDRQVAGLTPFSSQALMRAEGKTQEAAQSFLLRASQAIDAVISASEPNASKHLEENIRKSALFRYRSYITISSPIPMFMQRVANVERAQMLIESSSRVALQGFLAAWQPLIFQQKQKGLIRWFIDVDPLSI
jgi:primosomal protein N' (replication factor Y) (superfamily II helicase)